MNMVNEAEAVNAQRDAHMVGGSVLERRLIVAREERDAAIKMLDDGMGDPVAAWDNLHERIEGMESEAWGHGLDLRDARDDLASMQQERDELRELLAESRAESHADAARHAGRLIVACEERDAAMRAAGHFRRLYAIARHRIYAPSTRGRIWSWLRGKAGR